MKVVILIPARMAATRFPGKPLAPILGKPMIQWVYERSAQARAQRVIVATDSREIHDAVTGFGGEAAMTDPGHVNGTQRIAEVAAGLDAEAVVNVQGDEPAIHPSSINAVIDALAADPDLEMATLAERITRREDLFNPNVVKVTRNGRGDALYFSRAPIPYLMRPDMAERPFSWALDPRVEYLRHIGVYAFRRAFLLRYVAEPACAAESAEGLEQLRALHMGARIRTAVTQRTGVGVDTPEDIAVAERYLANECASELKSF